MKSLNPLLLNLENSESLVKEIIARRLFRPATAGQRFLPEGPYDCGGGRFSWVAIQHGGSSLSGTLNVFDVASETNVAYELPGRPGFAFPTTRENVFVIGLERHVRLFNTRDRSWTDLCGPVDEAVTGTIINDGCLFDGGLIFGCKDLKFQEKKAGLYLWRRADRRLIQMRNDQTCSNGKEVCLLNGQLTLLDIDSPTKTMVAYPLDLDGGTLGDPRVIVDCRAGESFPDGMILTPDGRSVIIAFYDPRDVPHGEARQYSLATGELETVWKTVGSPRVTCPQLIHSGGRVSLLLTTAVEHMTAAEESRHPEAGSIFIGDTDFTQLPTARKFAIE